VREREREMHNVRRQRGKGHKAFAVRLSFFLRFARVQRGKYAFVLSAFLVGLQLMFRVSGCDVLLLTSTVLLRMHA
jgi:hypothetical protein